MKKRAFAKINLCLDVISRREDGYHELEMVMVPIDLFDTVEITIAEKMQIASDKSFLPLDRRNTVINAIEVMREKYGFKENFNIRLVKNIPTQAGLAGGSTDAATAIKIINELLQLNMSENEMYEVAEVVGSDVPFCLFGKPAQVKGVGEQLSPIEINLGFYLFLAKPRMGVSTKAAFTNLDMDHLAHANTPKMVDALKENDYDKFLENLKNSLETPAIIEVPEILKMKEELISFGFDAALMSGSGSTIFAITRSEELVDRAVNRFWNRYWFVKKTRIIKDISVVEDIT